MLHRALLVVFLWFLVLWETTIAFAPLFSHQHTRKRAIDSVFSVRRRVAFIIIPDDGDEPPEEEEEEEEEENEEEVRDPYAEKATSEFFQDQSDLMEGTTSLDWGGALGSLRDRVSDVESGLSQSPSNALYRLMTSKTPNQMIGDFVTSADRQVVAAMSSAINSLLGGLSNPAMGVEIVVKTSSEKIGSLCFQLQMTGYMFRNAEYVLALKDIINLRGSKAKDDYKEAFDRLDSDGSGFIEIDEIKALLDDVYDGEGAPSFEVNAFMKFFDANGDGKISWSEFEKGLGDMSEQKAAKAVVVGALLPGTDSDDDDDDVPGMEPTIAGTIELELKDGKTIKIDAEEYMTHLREEANALKAALNQEKGISDGRGHVMPGGVLEPSADDLIGGSLAGYIASREGDLRSLTEGISPEIVETMKQLVDFVLEGGPGKKAERNKPDDKSQKEMELPGAALQQLALWQLVLGYRLREAEAKGEYLRLLDK